MKTSCFTLALLTIHSLPLQLVAQLVADGGTTVVNGVTHSLPGDLTVGTNGGNTTLIITNAGRVINGNATIGRNATSISNVVQVIGSGSVWSNSGSLNLGSGGAAGNLLTVADGAALFGSALRSSPLVSASNNHAIVTGPSSYASLGSIEIGIAANGCQLTISNGARVNASYLVAIGSSTGTNNRICITHGGTLVLTNNLGQSDLVISDLSSRGRNELLITEGGKLTNGWGKIGWGILAGGDTAIVSGPGSIWHNHMGLTVGNRGPGGHRLVVSNSAQVVVAGRMFTVGSNSSANSVLVTGPGSRLAVMGVTVGDFPAVGVHGSFNELVVADGGCVDMQGFSIGHTGSNNVVRITGSGSVLQLTNGNSSLFVGGGSFVTNRSRLVVDNGGQVFVRTLTIGGSGGGSSDNECVVTGPGSVLRATRLLIRIGPNGGGSDNRMTISDGGLVIAEADLYVGTSLSDGRLNVLDATLIVTNAAGTSALNIIYGTNFFDGGTIIADRLRATNLASALIFNRGTLRTRDTAITNGRAFVVGDGVNPATFEVPGGTHRFADGLVISPNATLRGCGTVNGTVINYGTIIAECSGQPLVFGGSVTNYGSIVNSGGTLQFNGPVASVILGISKTGPLATVTCTTVSGQNVRLLYKNLLDAGSWTEILPPISAFGYPISLNDPNPSSSNRFYRVRAD